MLEICDRIKYEILIRKWQVKTTIKMYHWYYLMPVIVLSVGYYGYRFVTPLPPSQCVERFHRSHSNKENIMASLLKFAGHIHNHKILPGNIFGLILRDKMATTGIFSTFNKDFCLASRAEGIISTDLKFAGYVPHYRILTRNIFGLILKKKMAATGVSLSVMKSA